MDLYIAGGVGKSGCSSYFIKNGKTSFFIDAGSITGAAKEFPLFRKEDVRNADFLFITHHHKDHTGAYEYLRDMGFKGTTYLTHETLQFMDEKPPDYVIIEGGFPGKMSIDDRIILSYGRTGHCLGSLWFHMDMGDSSVFTTGDMNPHSLSFRFDPPQGLSATLALTEAADGNDLKAYDKRRDELLEFLRSGKNRDFFFPLQADGRGLEITRLIYKNLENADIYADENVMKSLEMAEKDKIYVRHEAREDLKKITVINAEEYEGRNKDRISFILFGDGKMNKGKTQDFYRKYKDKGMETVITGSLKECTFAFDLKEKGLAKVIKFINHQNAGDAEKIIRDNSFLKTLITHSKKSVFIETDKTEIIKASPGEEISI